MSPETERAALMDEQTSDDSGERGAVASRKERRLAKGGSTRRWVERAASRPNMLAVGFGLFCTVVTWTPTVLAPTVGIDASWSFGLAYSGVHHLAWGPSLDFTYGPLGFLTVRTLYFGSQAALAFVYLFLVQLALFTLLFRFARTALPLWIAALMSYVIGATAIFLIDPGDLLMAPTFLLGIMAIRQQDEWPRRILLAVLSLIAAAGLLIKFTDGLFALGIVVVIIAIGWGRRCLLDAAISAVTFLFVLAVAWLASGNEIGNLPAYLKYSIAIASGYSSAMGLETGRTDEFWYAALVLLAVAILAILRLWSAGWRERVGTWVVLAFFAWVALKEGFIRHDVHDLIFFGLMIVTVVIFDFSLPKSRSIYLTTVTFVAVMTWVASGGVPENVYSLGSDTNGFGDQILTITNSDRASSTISTARAQMQATYGLDPRMVAELAHRTVAIEPYENSVAFAYPSIHWDPEPVLQTYSAYTSTLDALDSNFLTSEQAPSRILEQVPFAIDGRDPYFESPTAYVTTLCRYVQLDASIGWQILERVPDRCTASRPIGTVTATIGQLVTVPVGPPGTIVMARFDLSLPLVYDLSALVLKPPDMTFTAMGPDGLDENFRFIPGTAGDLHLLQPSTSLRYAPLFTPMTVSYFTLTGGGLVPGTSHYVVRFYSMRMAVK